MRFVRRALTLVTAGAVLAAAPATAAFAEGSRDLYPTNATCTTNAASGSCRANIEWRTNIYGRPADTHITRRTLFYVYATAGEVLEMGSSAVGVSNGDILVYNPGRHHRRRRQAAAGGHDRHQRLQVQRPADGVRRSPRRAGSRLAPQELAGPQAVSGGGNPTATCPARTSRRRPASTTWSSTARRATAASLTAASRLTSTLPLPVTSTPRRAHPSRLGT